MSQSNIKNYRAKIVDALREHVDIAIVGTSGGADSTLVTCLSKTALGAENVYAVSMPYNQFDEDTFNNRSQKLADKLKVHKKVIPIGKMTDALTLELSSQMGLELDQLTKGNARSRSRMSVLYAVGNSLSSKYKKRVRVIGTGNLSEDFIGYDTKGGDALADIFPIGELYKSEVYQMLDLYKEEGIIDESLIDRIPSAGLWDGQTDEEELGYSYDELQPAIENVRKQLKSINLDSLSETELFVYQRYIQNKHKHEAQYVVKIK